jgi:hypothetical protein
VASNTLSERSPVEPALSAKDLPGGWTQMIHVYLIRRFNFHLVDSNEDTEPESISATENWLI